MSFKPLKKKVLVASVKTENRSQSGIILDSATSISDSKTGVVMAVGPDVTEVVVGNRVLLDWTKAQAITVGGYQQVIIDEQHIVAVLCE